MDISQFGLEPHACKTLPGSRFGRLEVVATGKSPGTYRYKAICRCDCGTWPYIVRIDGLVSGAVTGCGCVQRERTVKHGVYASPLYQVWRHMVGRCTDPRNKSYARYGGRGISVCDRWMNPANFVADMSNSYQPGLELDREDNNGNYEPNNCRWVTHAQNADNRGGAFNLTFNGKTQSITRWAEETGIGSSTIRHRIVDFEWSVEKALTTPPIPAEERMAIARRARWG